MGEPKARSEPQTEGVALAVPSAPAVSSPGFSAKIINLPHGKELNEAAANRMCSAQQTRLIILAGQTDSGKTTLLTTLYELFQSGPVNGHNFSGSTTLPGFEERCYLARTQSGNTTSYTQRTKYSPDPEFLHLQVSPIAAAKQQIGFLFTDVSGEMFERACNSTAECQNLRFLRFAAHFVILLDSGKGVGTDAWAMLQASRSILQACLDSEMLSKLCFITFVWSKYDYFEAAKPDERELHEKFRDDAAKLLRDRFEHRVAKLSFRQAAARPEEAPSLGFGYGVAELFNDWIFDSTHSRRMDLQPPPPKEGRESELFASRVSIPLQEP
jgi:energy-coupling factor transporter ATP-binding protein EcfA2